MTDAEAGAALLRSLFLHGNAERYAANFKLMKKFIAAYHSDSRAQSIIDRALESVRVSQEDIIIFRELIERDMTVRQISERHNMHPSTVYRTRDRVIDALMPLVFGIDGILFEGIIESPNKAQDAL